MTMIDNKSPNRTNDDVDESPDADSANRTNGHPLSRLNDDLHLVEEEQDKLCAP